MSWQSIGMGGIEARVQAAAQEALDEQGYVGPEKTAAALDEFQRWAADRGLRPREIVYLGRVSRRHELRYTDSGTPQHERIYRTHYFSATFSDAKIDKLIEKLNAPPPLVVILPLKDWVCTGCSGTGNFLIMDGPGPFCLTCAGLDHLVFLPAGDAGLTRRATKASPLTAVVMRFATNRKRYERQGILVEPSALEQAQR